MTTPDTIAAQRADLLRQVVFDRPSTVPTDQRRLFSAEIGLTVHAFMADFYAAALAAIDPVKADQVAKELAEYLDEGMLPVYAWERAAELGHDPRAWKEQWQAAQDREAEKTPQPAAAAFVEPVLVRWGGEETWHQTGPDGTTVGVPLTDPSGRPFVLELDGEAPEILAGMLTLGDLPVEFEDDTSCEDCTAQRGVLTMLCATCGEPVPDGIAYQHPCDNCAASAGEPCGSECQPQP